MGYIYLINESGTDNYKIGLTTGGITKRKKELQTGNSNELVLIRKYETKTPRRLEKMLHMQHDGKRGLGEWFQLEPEDVFGFTELCDKLTKTIDFLIENNEFFKKA